MPRTKNKPRRFAEETQVPVARSREELESVLKKHGASQRLTYQDDEAGRAVVQFRIGERMVKLEMRREETNRNAEQVDREAWRRLLLVVRAKLEIVASGMSTLEREFLPDILLPNGQRVEEVLGPQIAQSYLDGGMPKLLGS